MSSPSRPASQALTMAPTSLRLRSFSSTFNRASLRSIGARSKCGGTTGSLAKDHLPFLTSCSGGKVSSSKWPTAEDSRYLSLSKYSPLRVNPPNAREMSAATDGFSAMMSFFGMRGREGYPQSAGPINCGEKLRARARRLQLGKRAGQDGKRADQDGKRADQDGKRADQDGKRAVVGDSRSSATRRLLGIFWFQSTISTMSFSCSMVGRSPVAASARSMTYSRVWALRIPDCSK